MDYLSLENLDKEAPYLPLEGYLSYAVLGIGYFILQHCVLHVVIGVVYPAYSVKMEARDRHEYRMQWNALVHSIIASAFALYCIVGTCPGDTHFFNDESCRHTVRFSHVWVCFFTAGYLLVETMFVIFATGVRTTVDKQALVHHVIAFLSYYTAFWQ